MNLRYLTHTPRRWWIVALVVTIWWTCQPFVELIFFRSMLNRGAFPVIADSIGIPLAIHFRGWLLMTPLILVFCLFVLWRYRGGVTLLHWNHQCPIRSLFGSITMGLVGIYQVYFIGLSVYRLQFVDAIDGTVALYLLAIARVILIAKHRSNHQPAPCDQSLSRN